MSKPEARIIHWQGNEITVEVSDEDNNKFTAMVRVDTSSDILGCVDISPQPDEGSSKMKEAKVSGVQLLKPGEDPAVMLYFVDEAFHQMTLPV